MCKCAFSWKSGVFIVLPLSHNQYKKNSGHYFWDIYQEKFAMKFNKVSWWALWFADPRNFDRRDRRKTLKKEKEKIKIRKSQTTAINIFLYRKIYIL